METFVYGTLAERSGASAVLDSFSYAGPADLLGLHRVEGQYPTLAPGGRVRGRILVTDEVEALDAYERVEDGLYVRVGVPLVADGGTDGAPPGEVQVYVGDPDRLDARAAWPGEGPLSERVRRYVDAAGVVVRRG